MTKRTCANSVCRKPFKPARDWSLYCSSKCGNYVRVNRQRDELKPGRDRRPWKFKAKPKKK